MGLVSGLRAALRSMCDLVFAALQTQPTATFISPQQSICKTRRAVTAVSDSVPPHEQQIIRASIQNLMGFPATFNLFSAGDPFTGFNSCDLNSNGLNSNDLAFSVHAGSGAQKKELCE